MCVCVSVRLIVRLSASGCLRTSLRMSVVCVRLSVCMSVCLYTCLLSVTGDLWSYNADKNVFVVSPQPDVYVYKLDPHKHKFVILASDGLWDMVKADEATDITHQLSTCVSVLVQAFGKK